MASCSQRLPALVSRRAFVSGTAAFAIAPYWPALGADPPVRFGLTPVVLDSNEQFQVDFRAALEAHTGRQVELVQRRSYQEIMTLLLSGQIHAAWICGYPYIQFASQLALLAAPVYRGQSLYQSYLVANAARPATSLDDLRGHVHAFSDPDSNSGYLVTRYLLAQQGETPASFFRETFFTYGHRNVIRAVAAGLADSGSAEGYVWELLTEIEPDLTSACQVVARSEWFGFPPIAALSTRRNEPEVEAIAAALLEMEHSDEGRRLLDLLRFDRFVAVTPEHYARIGDISRFVETRS